MIPLDQPRLFQTAVPAHPSQASGVRRMVATHLMRWQLSELLDNAVLATAELFANAVRHASRSHEDTIVVAVECSEQGVRVTVADTSPRMPRSRRADAAAESGRGLSIVSALVDDWGTAPPDPYSVGKKVWFTLARKDHG